LTAVAKAAGVSEIAGCIASTRLASIAVPPGVDAFPASTAVMVMGALAVAFPLIAPLEQEYVRDATVQVKLSDALSATASVPA